MSQSALNSGCHRQWPVRNYDLAATLSCGQAFRWRRDGDSWEGVIQGRWVRLRQLESCLVAELAISAQDWSWLENYLQLTVDLEHVVGTFPKDDVLQLSVRACWGLRLLRQDPWECLASFILSANKQIVQIQQIIAAVCSRWGDALTAPWGRGPVWSFPPPERIARASEFELRACKMGFRAPNLLSTARQVADGQVDLAGLCHMDLSQARQVLMGLPGVGRKIADCVLLFAYGFQEAFPVDVWVMRALRQLYFRRRQPSPAQVIRFIQTHFGPHAGYAQQYLFHYMRHHHPAPAS